MSRLPSSFYVTLPSSDKDGTFSQNTLSYFYNELAKPLYFEGRNFEVRLSEVLLEGDAGILAEQQASVIHGLSLNDNYPNADAYMKSAIYIYCNFIEGQLYGNQELQILRVVPIRKSWTYFETSHYVPVAYNTVQRVLIKITDINGDPFKFRPGHITLKLHFREVSE